MKARSIVKIRQKAKYIFDLIGTEKIRINALQAIPFWVASLLTGLIAVGYTKAFVYSENWLKQLLAWKQWSIFFMAPSCFFLAWLIVQLFAPNAKGSGIPQVMAAIDLANPKYDAKINELLSFRIIITKIASSLMMVLGGGAIGKRRTYYSNCRFCF